MEVFLLLVLGVVVIWLAARQGNASSQIASLANQLARLDQRLTWMEESFQRFVVSQAAAKPPAEAQPALSEVTLEPPATPAPASHATARPQSPSLAASQIHPPHDVPAFQATVQTAPQQPPIAPPLPPQPAAPPFIPQPNRSLSIEERLGANWLNKIGIVSVVIGVALFLALKLHTLGPAGKVAVGYVLAAVFLVGGLFLERRPAYRIFARAAIGGGWALTFFVTFAMYHVEATRVLTSQTGDLILMLLVAIGMVLHSLRYRSQVVTTLAFVLAFVTVALSDVTLFTLVTSALLVTGLVFVATREFWYELQLAGLLCVYLNHFHWLEGLLHYGAPPPNFPEFLPSAALLLFYWLLFRLAYVLRSPRTRREEGLAAVTAILNSFGLLGLLKLQSIHPEWAFYALLVLGAAELALAFYAWRHRRPAFVVLSSIAFVLLLAAIPFRYSGANWSLLWLLQAEAIFVAGLRLREVVFRRLGLIAGFAAAAHLVFFDALPILIFRQSHAGSSLHATIASTMLVAALLLWLNSQLAPLRWREILIGEIDQALLIATSYTALLLSALALWIVFPSNATIVAWMALAVLLSVAADLPKYLNRPSAAQATDARPVADVPLVSKLASQLAMQADLLSIAAIFRIFYVNLQDATPWFGTISERAITVGVASVLFYVITIRTAGLRPGKASYIAPAYSWAAMLALAGLAWTEPAPDWVATALSMLAVLVLFAGWAFKRAAFVAQANTLALLAGSRAVLYNLANTAATAAFWNLRLYTVAAPCAILLLALPVAFLVRRQRAINDTQRLHNPVDLVRLLFIQRPEQLLFFVPLAVITVFLAVQMRAGAVTVAWSALGVAVFLFALLVKERSYRLSGLGLLMLGVGKIVCVDIWSATVTDRIITLIVMGAALLLVSFLYSRYRETILKFL